jgi:hypothetical protein
MLFPFYCNNICMFVLKPFRHIMVKKIDIIDSLCRAFIFANAFILSLFAMNYTAVSKETFYSHYSALLLGHIMVCLLVLLITFMVENIIIYFIHLNLKLALKESMNDSIILLICIIINLLLYRIVKPYFIN